MALSPSSICRFHQNKHIMTSSSKSSLTSDKRFRNTTFYCWTGVRDTPGRKGQFLKFAVCCKNQFKCKDNFFRPAVSRDDKLPSCKREVFFLRTLGPQKTNKCSQIQFFADQANICISKWNRQKAFLQLWKATKNIKAWISEDSFNYSPQTTMTTFFVLWILLFSLPAYADDGPKIYACLLNECRVELAHCIADPACAANVACIEICNNRPDETKCQIICGDLFQNGVIDNFNQCALSQKKCVPQNKGEGPSPVPDHSALVKNFNITDFSGKWYISGGLNPLFDIYDCQVHEFYPTSKNLTGKLSWRISTPIGGFFTRHTIQRLVQDSSQPAILYNHDNEYLHYQDDWYILSSNIENKPDDYIFIYYRGTNDAWEGYAGAVVYTRTPAFPSSIVPKLEKAAGRVGLDFKIFKRTDNTCGPELPILARLKKKVEEGQQALAKEVKELEKALKRLERQK